VLHDLHDLSMFGTNKPFRGVVFSDVQFVWRDSPLTHWTIRIEPLQQPLHPQPLIEVLKEMPDEEIRTGQDDGRDGSLGNRDGS
jgi:hypothetical protein